MAALRWRTRDDVILPTASVHPGKDVILGGSGYTVPPHDFNVYRTFSPMVRRFKEQRGEPLVKPVDSLPAESEGSGTARSEAWRLPTPGHRLKWRLLFEDDRSNQSPILHVTRFASSKPFLGLKFKGFQLGLDFGITTAIDPLIEFSLMTPWGDGEENLRDHLGELAEDAADGPEEVEEMSAALLEFLAPYLPHDPPEGWEVGIEPAQLQLEEQESARVSVAFDAPTPGAVAFALQMVMVDGDERVATVSDVVAIEVPEDPLQATLLFNEDDGGSASELGQTLEVLREILSGGEAAVAHAFMTTR